MSDEFRKIGIGGKVTVKNGDKVIILKESNAIVRNGLRHIASALCGAAVTSSNTAYTYFGSYAVDIKFGKNIAATASTTDTLVATISTSPTSGIQNAVAQQGSGAYYYTVYTGSWGSGVLNASLGVGENLGEIGLYLNEFFSLTPSWYLPLVPSNYTYPIGLFSRISLGAASFVPDASKPVLVEWELGVDFI